MRISDRESEKDNQVIRVLIVEDQEILRIGLAALLQNMGNINVLGVAVDGPSAVKMALELRPGLILMDIGLPVFDGIEATRRIKEQLKSRILILTDRKDSRTVSSALEAGADGYCLKEVSTSQLQVAINAVADGTKWLDKEVFGDVEKTDQYLNSKMTCEPTKMELPEIETTHNGGGADRFCANNVSSSSPSDKGGSGKEIEIGSIFADRYEILSILGCGTAGVVYKARHCYIERLFAIKVMHAEYIADIEMLKRFRQEAAAANSLSHRNIVNVVDFGLSSHGDAFMIMDYLSGTNLDDLIFEQKGLSPDRSIELFKQIVGGLIKTLIYGDEFLGVED